MSLGERIVVDNSKVGKTMEDVNKKATTQIEGIGNPCTKFWFPLEISDGQRFLAGDCEDFTIYCTKMP